MEICGKREWELLEKIGFTRIAGSEIDNRRHKSSEELVTQPKHRIRCAKIDTINLGHLNTPFSYICLVYL